MYIFSLFNPINPYKSLYRAHVGGGVVPPPSPRLRGVPGEGFTGRGCRIDELIGMGSDGYI